MAKKIIYATGKRKTAIARVWLTPEPVKWTSTAKTLTDG